LKTNESLKLYAREKRTNQSAEDEDDVLKKLDAFGIGIFF
jgi:hypothetical protein